ncbi:hypothetical protein Dimus_002996 [Dionaea muscipula]
MEIRSRLSEGGNRVTMFGVDMVMLFSSFGVVKDAFIPRKKSKRGNRFGFVRYDCSVAAEVAIQKANGLWIKDKELKVKVADFTRENNRKSVGRGNFAASSMDGHGINQNLNNERRSVGKGRPVQRSNLRPTVSQFSREAQFQRSGSQDRMGKGQRSYVDVLNRGRIQNDEIPTVKGVGFGNGWLYRSAVATFGDHRTTDCLLENYLQQGEGDTVVRRMATNKSS